MNDERDKIQQVAKEFVSLERTKDALESTGLGCLNLGFSALLLVLAYQFIFYLRYGFWQEMGWDDLGLPVPQTNWVGIQKFIDWIADTHVGLLIVCLAFVIWVISQAIAGIFFMRAMEKKGQLDKLKQAMTDHVP